MQNSKYFVIAGSGVFWGGSSAGRETGCPLDDIFLTKKSLFL
jgi:hypothetical protein